MKTAKVKLLSESAVLPTKNYKSAGYDLHADIENPVIIKPSETVMIPTGLSITPPEGYFGAIFARSGMASKQGLAPANKVGVCDEDYTGQYLVALHNHGLEDATVNPRDRIAQLVFLPYASVDFEVVEEITATERGDGGFGSTGTGQ